MIETPVRSAAQLAAEAMAKKGAKMDAILTRYYPGATIVKSYA